MNFNEFINSDYLKSNPLCGIGTYKDELNLATGVCTRQIKKLTFTGNEDEDWTYEDTYQRFGIEILDMYGVATRLQTVLCTHYQCIDDGRVIAEVPNNSVYVGVALRNKLFVKTDSYTTIGTWKTYLQQQYAAGTPVTVWYVLATPTTETITVPSGLSGTEEGYLNQSGTPTPTNPIYPTANTVEKWFDLNHYIMETSTDTITTLPADLYPNDTTATVGLKGNMEQNGTPTPQNPIQPSECGDLETVGEKAGQYKIPISSANTTTPVYLGEVESTRTIKKLVLTGNESWNRAGSSHGYFTNLPNAAKLVGTSGIICSHYQPSMSSVDGTIRVAQGSIEVLIYDNYTSVADFKAYLAQQYANGVPVTVWYVLATPTTGIVNEPIRKIGDYADTVSGITIPTIAGANSFDVLTTLKPSEVTVNYKGWHTGAVHERDSGQWQ